MPYTPPTLAEIDTRLRQAFAQRLKEAGLNEAAGELNDPILRILFRTFAGQIENVYSDTTRIREALLDELISGLGLYRRTPRPAQTILRFQTDRSAVIPEGSELVGTASSQAKLTFATDATVAVSPARIAFALAYQRNTLQLLPSIPWPEYIENARPSRDPEPLRLGKGSALYVAVENIGPGHLSGHGLFLDVESLELQSIVRSEIWRVAQEDGSFASEGILRPRRGKSGVLHLEWAEQEVRDAENQPSPNERPALPDGFYAGRLFILPQFSGEQKKFLGFSPRTLDEPLSRIFRGNSDVLRVPRAWIRISFPEGVPDLRTAIQGVMLHTVSASNVIDMNQTISVAKHGTSMPVDQPNRFLLGSAGILGANDNIAWESVFETAGSERRGRYTIRNGRVDLMPPTAGQPDSRANVPVWVTNGKLGNHVEPGKVNSFVSPDLVETIKVTNPMAAAGGTDGELLADAHARFAETLLSRSRIVTQADLIAAIRGFDRRIQPLGIRPEVERTSQGLRRVHRVSVELRRSDFEDSDDEGRMLRQDLEQYLRSRVPLDVAIAVEYRWVD